MTTKQMIDGNKLIARFMGGIENEAEQYFSFETNPNSYMSGHWVAEYEALWYSSRWDWIMPVWLKIMDWGISEHGVQWKQEITDTAVEISNCNNGKLRIIVITLKGTLSVESIYSAVLQFIQWYNQSK